MPVNVDAPDVVSPQAIGVVGPHAPPTRHASNCAQSLSAQSTSPSPSLSHGSAQNTSVASGVRENHAPAASSPDVTVATLPANSESAFVIDMPNTSSMPAAIGAQ